MKQRNLLQKALLIIHESAGISKKEIAEKLGISTPKPAALIQYLCDRKCVVESEGTSNGGRIPKLYRTSESCGYLLGVDIGTEYVRIGIVTPGGTVMGSVTRQYDIDATRDLAGETFRMMLDDLYVQSGMSADQIVAVGIGITGIIHEQKGLCLSLRNTPGWKGLHVIRMFESLVGTQRILLTDSVKAMAVAERMYGDASGLDHFIVVNIGIGLGAGIVINGRLLNGDRGTTGEIGHMHIRPSQTLCVCGNYGCLESIASGWAILRKCKNAIREGVETRVGKDKELNHISVQDIIEAADQGDKIASTLLESMANDLGVGIGSVINLLNPQRIFLAGGLIQHAETHMYGQLIRGARSAVIPWLQETIRIDVSRLDELSVIRGVSNMAFEKHVIDSFA